MLKLRHIACPTCLGEGLVEAGEGPDDADGDTGGQPSTPEELGLPSVWTGTSLRRRRRRGRRSKSGGSRTTPSGPTGHSSSGRRPPLLRLGQHHPSPQTNLTDEPNWGAVMMVRLFAVLSIPRSPPLAGSFERLRELPDRSSSECRRHPRSRPSASPRSGPAKPKNFCSCSSKPAEGVEGVKGPVRKRSV